jgi:hypothetical protein
MKVLGFLTIAVLVLAGCEGDTGPQGPAGEDFPGPPPAEYVAADGIAGGSAYSKWWTTEAGGSGTQPVTAAPADFYRCKACHAWDGLGNAASYANRTGQSTLTPNRPDVSGVNLRSTVSKEAYQELFDLIRHVGSRRIDAFDNRHPDFAQNLTDDQVWDLVKFMREEWVAPNLLYDIVVSGPAMYVDYARSAWLPTHVFQRRRPGNEANGQACCRQETSATEQTERPDIEGMSLGQFVRAKPNEAWFKAKFGNPGTGMDPGLVSGLSDLQDLYRALANPVNYP